MRRKLIRLVAVLMLGLIVTSCITQTETGTTTDEAAGGPTAEDLGGQTETDDRGTDGDEPIPDFNDPSAGPDRAPNEPRQVPPFSLPSSAPGTDEATAALFESLQRFITPEQQREGVPWPDLRATDPVRAYESHAAFQNWMSMNNPTPPLVEAYTAPNSPERSFDLEMFGQRAALDIRSGRANPPYSMRVEDVVHPAATGITDTLLAEVPEGSAAIVYWDSVGPSNIYTADGDLWGSSDGWTDVGPWIAIIAPTDAGWQVWYDELEEPPPPGSRQQGPPLPQTNRRDV